MNFSFNFENSNLHFVKHRHKYYLISAIIIGVGMLCLLFLGLNLGVDFVGGTRLDLMHDQQPLSAEELSGYLEEIGHPAGEIVLSGNNYQLAAVTFVGTKTPDEVSDIRAKLEQVYGKDNITMNETTVTPTVARELAKKAIYAVVLASIGIAIYISVRFEYRFAMGALITLFHDALFVIGAFAILRLEVDIYYIAAVLTAVGYSINDTIIIFDRIRENMRFMKTKNMDDLSVLVDRSIVETLPRSINTSLTLIFVALLLFLLGSESIRNFSFALLIGVIGGTYSSLFLAAQIWVSLKARELKKKAGITPAN